MGRPGDGAVDDIPDCASPPAAQRPPRQLRLWSEIVLFFAIAPGAILTGGSRELVVVNSFQLHPLRVFQLASLCQAA